MFEPISKILDVVINGRPADAPKPKAMPLGKLDRETVSRLIIRRQCVVMIDGKRYEIIVKPVSERE